MACDAGFDQWTFDLVLDKDPTTLDSRLVFCIKFLQDGKGTITGKVFDINGSPLSDVSGRNLPFTHVNPGGGGVSLMSLDFSMNSVNVSMGGIKVGPRFEGRLRAFVCAEFVAAGTFRDVPTAIPLTPGDGDTGTATGTQT